MKAAQSTEEPYHTGLSQASVLVIDDDQQTGRFLAHIVRRIGHRPIYSSCLRQGIEAAKNIPCDVVLLDVNLPDGNGLDYITSFQQAPSEPEVIVITGFGDREGAELAVRNGAWDYIQKGDSYRRITLPIERALEYRRQRARRNPPPARKLDFAGICGRSKVVESCLEAAAQAAGSTASVLITGETGTGKEVFARAIHKNSARSQSRMIVVDCTALPETLVESLLFGHEKGIYTGADKASPGLVAQADGGTLFLDEIGELPLTLQKVFLRVLQEHSFRPVGGQQEIRSDFRLIAATNRDLDDMVSRGLFRRDLLYRIRAMQINLPPLRDRIEDIQPLSVHYADKICRRNGIQAKILSPDFIEDLQRYCWPGNVRELINTLEITVANHSAELTLYARNLPDAIRVCAIQSTLPDSRPAVSKNRPSGAGLHHHQQLPPLKEYRKMAVGRAEEEYLKMLLTSVADNVRKAQDISGLSRSRFYQLVKCYGIPMPAH